MLGIAVLAIASMTAGLLISAVVNSSDKTMPLLVVTVLVEVVLSGGSLPAQRHGGPGTALLALPVAVGLRRRRVHRRT